MSLELPVQVTAFQVGNYFVGQYYSVLQQQPGFAYQFYNESSTMLRLDGARIDRATGMLGLQDPISEEYFHIKFQQIHTLLMCQNYTGIQITAAHSLDSWNGGVLVVVSGLVQTRDNIIRRKFLQTFFLAPQEKGYFVLNDVLQFLGEEHMHQYPAAILAHNNYPSSIIASNPISESVSNYFFGGAIHTREFAALVPVRGTVAVDGYSIPEPTRPVPESAEKAEVTSVGELTTSLANITNLVRDPPTPAEEHVGEPTKHTYASILRVAKVQPGQSVSQGASLNKMVLSPSGRLHVPQVAQEAQSTSTLGPEKSEAAQTDALENEGESRSVYVGNLPPSITTFELEEEFKKYGTIRLDGVAIRSRKETGVLYAFVEFEDSISVQNALKASPVEINGRCLHVEGRRPNSGIFRGRRGGRGRGGYRSDAFRRQYGGRTSGQENGDKDYNDRTRGNGYPQRGSREERGILGNHNARN